MTSAAAWKGSRLPLLIPIALALGFAVHATRTAPAPVTARPMPVFVAPTPAPSPGLAPPSPSAPPPAPPTAPQRGNIPGLSVNATFAGRAGDGSIFVTRPDGSRALVAAGDDVVPAVRLVAVAADRATFATHGTQFWLPLRAADAASVDPAPATMVVTASTPPQPAPATGETQRRESLAYQAALAPSIDGPYRGYAVRAPTPLFAKAGLKPGDLITSINGRAFDSPGDIASLSREASLSATMVFTVRRNGRSQELRADPG